MPGRSRITKNLIAAAVVGGMGLPLAANAQAQKEEGEDAAGHRGQVLRLAGEHQVTLGAGLTIVGQRMTGGEDDSGLTYSADLAFEGDFGNKGKAFIYINTAQGEGIDTGAAMGANADNESGTLGEGGYSETRVAEAWYQFPVNEVFAVTIGKIDPTGFYDANAVANDETTQFLNDAFVNNPAIAMPGYVGGLNVTITPSENVTVNVGAYESGDDFQGSLSDSFLVGEVAFAGQLGGRDGNVRLTLWNEDSTENQGVAVSVDQMINDQLTVFARYGTQDDDQPFDQAFTLGGQWAWDRETFGLAYGLLTATADDADDESHVELYWRHALNDNVHVTFDAQSAMNPGFDGDADDVFVYGGRVQLDF